MWSLDTGWQILSKTSYVMMNHFKPLHGLCSRKFQIVQLSHLAAFDSWVLCTLNYYGII